MPGPSFTTSHQTLSVASAAGVLPAKIIRPSDQSGLPPLVVLHGISRNADELVDLFRAEAERSGRIVVIPHFSEKRWPIFQRPSRAARPDLALLALLTHVAAVESALSGSFDLFGHSGGAQLAHRFAMLYPHKVGRVHLVAAGWYCLPDAGMPYPYGLGANETPGSQRWVRRHEQALAAYLRLKVQVFVGTNDIGRDESLRKNHALDLLQGRTRLARAETYVQRFTDAAHARAIRPDITLIHLPGVAHDVAEAIRKTGLARLVADRPPPQLAAAS